MISFLTKLQLQKYNIFGIKKNWGNPKQLGE
jgi:flagellum-specific peptidoglycan hydrolase FlgJ